MDPQVEKKERKKPRKSATKSKSPPNAGTKVVPRQATAVWTCRWYSSPMLRSSLSLLFLFASATAFAGDCPSHPVTLLEFEVLSCARLDAANASHVVPYDRLARNNGMKKELIDAEVSVVVAEQAAFVLQVKTRRARTVQIDGRGRGPMKPEAEAWRAEVADRWLVLRTNDADACKKLQPKGTAVLAQPTDCSCDTGPHGWCAVSREAIVVDVPKDL